MTCCPQHQEGLVTALLCTKEHCPTWQEEPRNGPRMLVYGLLAGVLTWALLYGVVEAVLAAVHVLEAVLGGLSADG